MSLQESKVQFLDGVVELLWKQWSALGVSAHAGASTDTVLDLEALIVFSSWAARYDERLYDLVLSWLVVHGDVVNIQRLKALAKKSAFTDTASLCYMADTVVRHGGRKWAALADAGAQAGAPVPLFLSPDGAPESFCPRHDDAALRYGFIRVPFSVRNLVVSPDSAASAAAILRLRGLCGVSARADILAALINGSAMTAAELAAFCGFTWKSTNEALQELCSSGLLHEIRLSTRGCSYKLKDAKQFAAMLSAEGCAILNWFALFEAIGTVWRTLSNPRLQKVSPEAIRGELELLGREITSSLVMADLPAMTGEEHLIALPRNIVAKCFDSQERRV